MFLILALILFFVSIYFYLTWNFDYWKNRGVPYVKPTAVFGNFPSQWTRKEHATYELQRFYDGFKSNTPFLGVFQFRTPKLLLFDPEIIKDVMIKNFSSFHDNEFAKMVDKESDLIFSRNPFMLRGEEWKAKRAEITPALTKNRLKVMFPIVEDTTKKFIKYVEERIAKDADFVFNAREISAKYTCDVVSSCAFGVDAQSFKTDNPEIMKMGQELLKPTLKQFLVFLLLTIAPNIAKLLKIGFVPKRVEKFFVGLMEDAIKYREDHKIDRHDYLEYLINLRNKKEIEPIDMAAHGVTFFTDGFETSSVAISHVFYELGKNKDVQDNLRKEILDVYGRDGQLSFEKNSEFVYLDQVFNETLRMHSPAVFTSRECTNPTVLKAETGESVFIEKDLSVWIPILAIHYDPKYYENPNVFNPDRFEGDKVKEYINNGLFMPFGAGPRICLGRKFATMQSKAIIAEVIRNFEISVNSKTEDPLIIDPKEFLNVKRGGLWLNFKKLD